MLGQLPVGHLVAMLGASPPAGAVTILLGMPPERLAALVEALPEPELTRLSADGRVGDLLAATPDPQLGRLLGALADPVAVVAALPDPELVRALAALAGDDRARLAARLPEAALERARGLGAELRDEDLYRCRLTDALARMVTVRPGPVAEVLGKDVLVVALPGPDAEDLHAAVVGADWTGAYALLAVSPLPPTDRAQAHLGTVRDHGYRVELLRWSAERGDAPLKRALARLVGE